MISSEVFQLFLGYKKGMFAEKNGCLYASDGHILIELSPGHDLFFGDGDKKNISRFLDIFDTAKNPITMNSRFSLDEIEIKQEQCQVCEGKGAIKTLVDCVACCGVGTLHDDVNGLDYQCPLCEGEGTTKHDTDTVSCDSCKGRGFWYEKQKVGNVEIDGYYLSMIKLLPNAEIITQTSDRKACYFYFNGGRGAVMPMQYPR